MTAAAHELTSLAQVDEAPSTSCSEEAVHSRGPSVKSRSLWKVAAVAAVVALIAVAGTSWARNTAVGDEVEGLASQFTAYGTIGCSNWKSIMFTSTVVAGKAACQTACDNDALCTSFNWQELDCVPPPEEGVGSAAANTCMIFHGACATVRNSCWELDYKSTAGPSITQQLEVTAEGPATGAEAGVEAALEADPPGFNPVETEVVADPGARRLQEERNLQSSRTIVISWTYSPATDQEVNAADTYAKKLMVSTSTEYSQFFDAVKTKAGTLGCTVTDIVAKAPTTTYMNSATTSGPEATTTA